MSHKSRRYFYFTLLSLLMISANAITVDQSKLLKINLSPSKFIQQYNKSISSDDLNQYKLKDCSSVKSGTYANALSFSCTIDGGGYASFYSESSKKHTYFGDISLPINDASNKMVTNVNMGKVLYAVLNPLNISQSDTLSLSSNMLSMARQGKPISYSDHGITYFLNLGDKKDQATFSMKTQ